MKLCAVYFAKMFGPLFKTLQMKSGRKNIYHRLPFLNNDYKARIYTGKYTYKIYYE